MIPDAEHLHAKSSSRDLEKLRLCWNQRRLLDLDLLKFKHIPDSIQPF